MRPYVRPGSPYAEFQAAFRLGWESRMRNPRSTFERLNRNCSRLGTVPSLPIGCLGIRPGRRLRCLATDWLTLKRDSPRPRPRPGREEVGECNGLPRRKRPTARWAEIVNRVVDSFGKLAGDRLQLVGPTPARCCPPHWPRQEFGRPAARLPSSGWSSSRWGRSIAGGLRNDAAASRYLVGASTIIVAAAGTAAGRGLVAGPAAAVADTPAPQERTAGASEPLPVLAAAANSGEPGRAKPPRPARPPKQLHLSSAVVHGRGLAANSLTAAAAADPINATFRSDLGAPDGTRTQPTTVPPIRLPGDARFGALEPQRPSADAGNVAITTRRRPKHSGGGGGDRIPLGRQGPLIPVVLGIRLAYLLAAPVAGLQRWHAVAARGGRGGDIAGGDSDAGHSRMGRLWAGRQLRGQIVGIPRANCAAR